MPEYLSPGVFIEEIPARLKAIEGVSTSTAGFVGAAERGVVPGYPLPFAPPAGFDLPLDRGPVLVTSFAEFSRSFGPPLPLPASGAAGHLARAVRAFFDNGGRRCFVTRVVHFDPANLGQSATRATVQLAQGSVNRLARRVRSGDTDIFLTSLRNVDIGTNIELRRADGSLIGAATNVQNYDAARGLVTLANAVGQDIEPGDAVAVVGAMPTANAGPVFHARTPGEWANELRIDISNFDGPLVRVAAGGAAANAAQVPAQMTSSFYRGAIIQVDYGVAAAVPPSYHTVVNVQPGNVLQIAPVIPQALSAAGSVRVVGINVTIELRGPAPVLETYQGLTWNPAADPETRRRHYATVINARSRLVYVQPPGIGGLGGAEAAVLANQPTSANGLPITRMAVLGADNLANLGNADYVGVDNGPGSRTGIASLAEVDDIRIIAAPGITAAAVQTALVTQAERMRYRFAVLDGQENPNPNAVVAEMLGHRNAYDSAYAAYYVPWVQIEEQEQPVFVPPSGYVAGIYARVDNDRGVWKAPANEVVRGALGLRANITTGEQDVLNPRGVNVIRTFEGRGTRVWGARTTSSDPENRYVSTRRFLIFLEASLDRGTQWVVFEPNAPETWSRVTDSVSAFLHTQWRAGALFGRRPEDAFFVRCDETTMTVDDVQNGRLICEIGVAIVRPAEFVILRIEQITGFARQT